MMSWGVHAHERVRPTEAFPTFSAVCGILGAALGVARNDHCTRQAVRDSFSYAARLDDRIGEDGRVIQTQRIWDYQTVSRLVACEKRRPYIPVIGAFPPQRAPRRLSKDGTKFADAAYTTMPTRREYVSDVVYTVLVEPLPGAEIPYDVFLQAVRKPLFRVSFGRANCLPTRPIFEAEVEASSFTGAFAGISPGAGTIWSPEASGAFRRTMVRDYPLFGTPALYVERKVYVHFQERREEVAS